MVANPISATMPPAATLEILNEVVRKSAAQAKEAKTTATEAMPGGDVNPYLAVTAMIAAGLHGIEHELPLEPPDDRQRLLRHVRAGAAHPARRPGPVGEERAGPGVVRRGGGGALRQLRPGRVDRLRGRGDRLGAAALLRAPVNRAPP